ncbi:MAG: chromate transporter, partial [Chloroflexi bacterium]|nr:chromate transporter [Chloroflexota bacterium]
MTDVPPPTAGSLRELASTFLRLGLTAFGGPAAHIALFRHELVERRRWLTEQRYLDLLATANVLPGPTSTEVAIAIGHDRAGLRGMLVSGVLFILPASLLVLVLAVLYERFGTLPEVQPLLYGMQPVVVAIVVHALVGLARAALRSMIAAAIAAAATALAVLGVDPILVLATGGAAAALARLAVLGSGDRSVAGLLALPGMLGAGGATGAGAGTIGAAAGGGAAATAGTFAGAIGLVPLFLVFLKIGLVVFGSGYVLLAFLRADLV